MLYNSLIVPHLQYGILVWGYQIGRLAKTQKKAIRIITASKYNSHTEPLFKKLNLLKIQDIISHNELKFYYKYINNQLPKSIQSLNIQRNNNIHNHLTRIQNDLHCVRVKHEYAKKRIVYNLPKTVNSTPTNIKSKVYTHSFKGFSNYVKNYLLGQYSNDCYIQNCYICNRG